MVVCSERYAKGVLGMTESDRCFSVAKLFFAYGLGNALYFPLAVGGTSILWSGPPKPQHVFDIIERYRPTLFFSVPSNYASLLAYQKDSAAGDFVLGAIDFSPNRFLTQDLSLISHVDPSNAAVDVFSLAVDVTGLSAPGALAASIVA